jgi:hypothetical protein
MHLWQITFDIYVNIVSNVIQLKVKLNTMSAVCKFPYQRVYVYTLAMVYGHVPIITHHMNSSFEFNQRTSIKHANAFILFIFSMIITGWWWWTVEIAWSVVTECGLRLTNINCICESEWDPQRNREEC